jgi:chitinase
MQIRRMMILSVMLLCLLPVVVRAQEAAQPETNPYRVIGYYSYYNVYNGYPVTSVPVDLITHLNYTYITISDNGQCESTDTWADTRIPYEGDGRNERLRGNFKQLQLLKQANPELRVIMTVGGWEHSARFSDVAADRDTRIRFTNSCIAFMREYGFDGIEIDWRYPVSGGRSGNSNLPEDRANLTLLLAEFRGQIEYWNERDDERYELSVVMPAVEELLVNYELDLMPPYVDWLSVTSYGFQGGWSEIASHAAPLHPNTRDPRGDVMQQEFNVEAAINAYLDAGVPAEKLVLGIPLYAQAWRGVRPNDYFGLYEAVAPGAPNGTRDGGILYYRDLIPLFSDPQFVRFFDPETSAAWLYNEDERIGISYDNPESVQAKALFVRQRRMGGVMLWELAFDDDAHTILSTVHETLTIQPVTGG